MQGGQPVTIKDVANAFNRDELEAEVSKKAVTLGLDFYDARKVMLQPDVLSLVSKDEAAKGVLPVSRKEKHLILGVVDPNNEVAKKCFEELSKYYEVQLALVSWESIKDALPKYQGLAKQNLEERPTYEIEAIESPMTFAELEAQINGAPIQDILKYIITMAIESGSSDIHFEPQKVGARVRFRIDGVLHIVAELTAEKFKYILSQIELSSGLKLNVNEAQEGRLEVKQLEGNISVRVETMPTLYGDDISLRIFNTEATMLSLNDLGLQDYAKEILEKSLARPHGMILVVGPTGAGKSSTIYAVLNALNKPEVKIVSLEDPIEYALPGVTQSQINEGESFVTRLKAVLREDPDIVMVGEIRDSETADVALHAALTGHVMISTFHANNAVTAVGLLKEISTSKALLASSINLIIGQRLVRKLCLHCKKEHELTPIEKEFVDRVWSEIPENLKLGRELKFFESTGCDSCDKVGYKGRIGIFELLSLNTDLQKIISREDMAVMDLEAASKKSGMVTMEQDGLLKALDRVTSLSEVMKAIKE